MFGGSIAGSLCNVAQKCTPGDTVRTPSRILQFLSGARYAPGR